MGLFSMLSRVARRLFPADPHVLRGEPHAIIGQDGTEAGVWIAYALDGMPAAYVVGSGECLLVDPVAICFGSGPDGRLTRDDFAAAKAVAADWRLAGLGTGNTFDLRGFDLRDEECDFLWEFVLFPTNRRGLLRQTKAHYGVRYVPGGVSWSMAPHVAWEPTRTAPVPTFGMNIDSGWAPVPADLKNHLDQIDPQTKKCGQSSAEACKPGQLASIKTAELTAA